MPLNTIQRPPIIRADSPDQLLRELRRLGHEPEQIFVKVELARRLDYLIELPTGHVPTTPATNLKYNRLALANEFRRLARMHSIIPENVVEPIALIGSTEGKVAGYVMEFVRGKNLSKQSLSPSEALAILAALADTVSKLQASGTAHGDIHWDNIIMEGKTKWKLVDPFPASKLTDFTPEKELQGDLKSMFIIIRHLTQQFDIPSDEAEKIRKKILDINPSKEVTRIYHRYCL